MNKRQSKSDDKVLSLIFVILAWTIIQRRFNGTIDFYRNWNNYKNGFGDLRSEFWLGNEKIHQLTNQGRYASVDERNNNKLMKSTFSRIV